MAKRINRIKRVLNNIPINEWQYILPILICGICYIASDFLGIIQKTDYAYWSGGLLKDQYRVFTYHFIHIDIKHLLANGTGIAICRYCFKELELKLNWFFLILILLLMPLQSLLLWIWDIVISKNSMSLAVGFSGLIYGIEAFILLSSIFGKKRFLCFNTNLKKNSNITKITSILVLIGLIWSFMPGISLAGHLTGFTAGLLMYMI